MEVALRYKDAKGGNISAAKREFVLPPGCLKVEVVARSLFAVGTFDFDDVRVEFK